MDNAINVILVKFSKMAFAYKMTHSVFILIIIQKNVHVALKDSILYRENAKRRDDEKYFDIY